MSKLLGHFLQEQQEPFALEVFLVERGCRRGIKKSPNCAAFLKAVFGRNAINLKGRQENARCSTSSACSTALFNSEVGGERKKKGRGDEDLSPVSVLDETESDQHSPTYCELSTEEGESSNSISKQSFQRLKEFVGRNSCDQYSVNMRALQQQRKQLQLDCVREVMQNVEKEREEIKKMLGAEEEAWKTVCENVGIWSKDSINGSNVLHLLRSDFLASQDGWNADFVHKKMEISNEVGNAIFEDVINEIVTFYFGEINLVS
ncbi:hypothetical protein ACS0TY_023704 [Phlomoides rotata]